MVRLLSVFLCCLSFLATADAQFAFGVAKTTSKATLFSETSSISAGKPFTVALQLEHPAGWHSYYRNSGGVELPPTIRWHLPEGFTSGPIQWPVPEVKDALDGSKSFVYNGSPVFLIEISPPVTLSENQTLTITADATWQICKESCINEKRTLTLTLPVSSAAQPDPATAALFSETRAKLPKVSNDLKISATSEGSGDVVIRLDSPSLASLDPVAVDFIPNEPFLGSISSGGSATKEGNTLVLKLKRNEKDVLDRPITQGTSFSGVLTGNGATAIGEVPIKNKAMAPVPPSLGNFLVTLLSMFMGGLILNLMPCVFPVIGLKIMGFVQQSGQDRRKIVLHGVTFTLGVLASFGVLSGVLYAAKQAALKQGGQAINWGYQLQNPWVILCLMFLMFLLALSMYGVFEIGTSATSIGGSLQRKQGVSGSFFSGILATVVATPCSAPFLGTALGAAVAFPALQFFLAFAVMALGLSTPYLVLSAFPRLVDYLPRPGAWMESFKQGLSFLLFATAGYLLWVYAGQIGLENLLGPIFGLSLLAIAAWIYGRWQVPYRGLNVRRIAMGLALLIAALGIFLSIPPKPSSLIWEKWSEEKVEELIKEGKPVYLDFTAQWCATCQVNKKRAYTEEVIALIHKKGIVTLKGDKTNPDPLIEAKLQELGRSAIPVNVLIVPGKDPIITPEILSASYLKELFEKELPDKK